MSQTGGRADIVMVDQHQIRLDQPDALFIDLEGDITGQNIRDILVYVEQLGKGKGPVYFIQDLSKARNFSAAARKAIADDVRTSQIALVICVRASFQMRVLMTMIERTRLIFKREVAPVRFAGSMEEATQMLAAEREKRRQMS